MQPTLELAAEQNFHPWLYMVVNPDLMEAYRKDRTFDAAAHFHQLGIAEKKNAVKRRCSYYDARKISSLSTYP